MLVWLHPHKHIQTKFNLKAEGRKYSTESAVYEKLLLLHVFIKDVFHTMRNLVSYRSVN